ncbi:MAG: DUF2520 domain-containing protein [Chitinophagales bacterium]|nr:DUF2520 domain-containing protein [Chitinophagaceae bacterium]MCB9064192.1 DUF2520 domain-containing protein [Chitinophagales bacterium]
MTFYIAGTGNTAWFMATRLVKAGNKCLGVWGRNIEHANDLADVINAPVLHELSQIKDDADGCILAITDNAIEDIAKQLSFEHTTLIHTAGSVSRMVLQPYAQHAGIMWPVYSIVKDNLPKHREIPIVIKGTTDHSEEVLKKLVADISDICYTISWEQRQWLHLCAVMSNNFVNHMMAISEEICNKQQIPFSLLYPIVNQTTERIKHASPKKLQTGPAKRNDVNTIEKHLEMLAQNPQWKELYESITTSIDKMYRKNKGE